MNEFEIIEYYFKSKQLNNHYDPILGIGDDAAIISIDKKEKLGCVIASDAFFPFTDNIKILLKLKCEAIIQPRGSINDKKIINLI